MCLQRHVVMYYEQASRTCETTTVCCRLSIVASQLNFQWAISSALGLVPQALSLKDRSAVVAAAADVVAVAVVDDDYDAVAVEQRLLLLP
jgi:hypothetical protein